MAVAESVSAGRMLRESLDGLMAESEFEWDEKDQAVLRLIEDTRDRIEEFEAVLAKDGLMVKGSRGQTVVHPAAQEVRHSRQELSRLLDKLNVPSDESVPVKSERHQRAARASWMPGRRG